MNPITDYTSTNNSKSLYAASKLIDLPDWFEKSAAVSADDLAGLSPAAFACPQHRLLPMHTKKASLCSLFDFYHNFEQFSPVSDDATGDRLMAACKQHGCTKEASEYLDKLADKIESSGGIEKSASEETQGLFALDIMLDNTPVKVLPINDVMDIEDSSRELMKMAAESRIPAVMFGTVAGNITKRAAELGVVESVPTDILLEGSNRTFHKEASLQLLESRKRFTRDADTLSAYSSLVSEAEGREDLSDLLVKFATLDESIGVIYDYQDRVRGVPSPQRVLLAGSREEDIQKEASTQVLVSESLVPLECLKRIPNESLEYELGDHGVTLSQELSKKASCAVELTRQCMGMDKDSQIHLLNLSLKYAD